MIDTILLIPDPEDRHGLLADGVCGARPPTLVGYACNDVTHGRWWPENAEHEAPVCPECSARKRWCDATALVLAHGGKPVAEGCDRARSALTRRLDGVHPQTGAAIQSMWVPLYGSGGVDFVEVPRQIGWELRTERRGHYFYAEDASGAFERYLPGLPVSDVAHALAFVCAARLGARLVLLDADGREVTP